MNNYSYSLPGNIVVCFNLCTPEKWRISHLALFPYAPSLSLKICQIRPLNCDKGILLLATPDGYLFA